MKIEGVVVFELVVAWLTATFGQLGTFKTFSVYPSHFYVGRFLVCLQEAMASGRKEDLLYHI